jgi:hypothetical protein
MTTESKIIEICKAAMDATDEEKGDNWADFVESMLGESGIPTDYQLARAFANAGHYDVIAVIEGKYFTDNSPAVVPRDDSGTWAVDDISVYQRRRIFED